MHEDGDDARGDVCLCGAVVFPQWSSDREGSGTGVERGSCTECGLQLVRLAGESWRQIRG